MAKKTSKTARKLSNSTSEAVIIAMTGNVPPARVDTGAAVKTGRAPSAKEMAETNVKLGSHASRENAAELQAAEDTIKKNIDKIEDAEADIATRLQDSAHAFLLLAKSAWFVDGSGVDHGLAALDMTKKTADMTWICSQWYGDKPKNTEKDDDGNVSKDNDKQKELDTWNARYAKLLRMALLARLVNTHGGNWNSAERVFYIPSDAVLPVDVVRNKDVPEYPLNGDSLWLPKVGGKGVKRVSFGANAYMNRYRAKRGANDTEKKKSATAVRLTLEQLKTFGNSMRARQQLYGSAAKTSELYSELCAVFSAIMSPDFIYRDELLRAEQAHKDAAKREKDEAERKAARNGRRRKSA